MAKHIDLRIAYIQKLFYNHTRLLQINVEHYLQQQIVSNTLDFRHQFQWLYLHNIMSRRFCYLDEMISQCTMDSSSSRHVLHSYSTSTYTVYTIQHSYSTYTVYSIATVHIHTVYSIATVHIHYTA